MLNNTVLLCSAQSKYIRTVVSVVWSQFGFTDGRLVSLDLSQQISFTQLLSDLLLPALHCSHRHGGREGRKCDL